MRVTFTERWATLGPLAFPCRAPAIQPGDPTDKKDLPRVCVPVPPPEQGPGDPGWLSLQQNCSRFRNQRSYLHPQITQKIEWVNPKPLPPCTRSQEGRMAHCAARKHIGINIESEPNLHLYPFLHVYIQKNICYLYL